MTPPLMIASVYGPSPLNAAWYALQKRFIAETTTVAHTFGVVLNGVHPGPFDAADVIDVTPDNEGHARALERVLGHCRRHAHPMYLILDSDCFPVHRGWHEVLVDQMRRFGRTIAAPVRVENLDLYPHPSAMFLLRRGLETCRLDFTANHARPNLLGEAIADVGTALRDVAGHVLPLLRTNVVNVHPVAAALYHHLFYHHGAGSRADFAFRVLRKFRYHEHWYDSGTEAAHRDELLAALFDDPHRFIGVLRGEAEPRIRRHLRGNGLVTGTIP
jgi:hypothetical protein